MIRGKVIHGDGLGKSQGYATANLDFDPKKTHLKTGCYAAWAEFRGRRYPAALIVGGKPGKIEAHLLEYTGNDFYGEQIIIDPLEKVSETVATDSVSDLKAKIDEDLRQIRLILKI